MSVVRIFIVVIAAAILCGFTALGVHSAVKTRDNLEFQKIQLKSKTSDIQELNIKYDKLNLELNKASQQKDVNQDEIKNLQQQKQDLEDQKKKLESELQAKIETKNSIASAASKVVATATGTSTASAATSGGSIEGIITEAALKYGLSPSYMIKVANCESSLDPTKTNYNYTAGGGHPNGLFQFIPSTWADKSAKAGYGGADVFDASAAANVAAWAFANGQSGEWACA